ncbi:MAG: peptidylprolyl isomerase [Paludibacteraceae bacterium]|nr:peptidylprolyl isomerase [Paludibacteraceae bacterium]
MNVAKYIASVCALTSISASAMDLDIPGLMKSINKSDDPVLMIIGTEAYRFDTITRGEFEYMYNKNNNISLDGPMSMDDYKELFINYKLKAFDATKRFPDLKLNTYISEIESYTKHLAYPYLIDEDIERQFINEAYKREQEYITASHILIKGVNEKSRKKIESIYSRLKNGEKFFDLAKENSDCGSAVRGGFLGEFSAFDMVYNFETVAYNTPVGEISKPFTTQFGYHIIYIHDRRPKAISVKAQEIFFPLETRETYVDSIFAIAKKSKKFEKVAKKYSMKSNAKKEKGDMGVVKDDGSYPHEVVDKLFKMPVGDIQKFRSSFGYHIFRVYEMETAEPLDSAKYEALKKKVMSGDRYEAIKGRVAINTREKRGFLLNDSIIDLATSYKNTDPNAMSDTLKKIDGAWYYYNGDAITTDIFKNDFLKFHASYFKRSYDKFIRTEVAIDTNLSYKQNLINFINSKVDIDALNSELKEIAKNNKEFVYALKEYSDGLLVYAASEHNVWGYKSTKADSLSKFFRERKENYQFDNPKWVGIIYSVANKDTLKKIKNLATKNPNLDAFDFYNLVKDNVNGGFTSKKGAWVAGENAIIDKYYFKTIPADSTVESEKFPLVYIYGKESKIPQWHTLVKGKVIADYQKELEKNWINNNRRIYPVVIKEDVYKTVNNH